MDSLTSPGRATESSQRGHGVPLAVAALIVAMVALSIFGSARWRPEPLDHATLELGNATPVRLAPASADSTIATVLQTVAPTVAFITLPELRRSGSGVVVHDAGFVVTNAHVVDGAEGEQIRVAFDDGEEYDAALYGIDMSTDLAVIKLDTDEPVPVATLGDSDALRVGEFVLALGAPFGLEATATSGIVSGLHRSGLGIARFEDFIVTDAPINRGNSGGPLVNLRGEVVGINTAIIAGDEDSPNVGTFAGVGFAIPVNVMRVIAQRLIGDGGLGLETEPAEEAGGVAEDAGGVGEAPPARRFGPQTIAYVEPPRAVSADRRAEDPEWAAGAAKRQPGSPSVGYVRASDRNGNTVGRGTGFMIEAEGERYMVTNEHVVRGAATRGSIQVYFGQHPHGVAARLLVSNFRLDLALLALPPEVGATPLPVGRGDHLAAGSVVFGQAARVDTDRVVIHELAGQVTEIPVEVPRVAPDAVKLATDIETERGDSGGPLFDENGAVVAVMVARDRDAADADLSSRRSYAILLRPDVEVHRLIVEGQDPGFDPGFQPIWPRNGRAFILVLTVEPDGLAEQLGIEPRDRIVSIDGQPVPVDEPGQRAMFQAFLRLPAGREVPMVLERGEDDDAETYEVTWVIPERAPAP